jgi:hypothetical protein
MQTLWRNAWIPLVALLLGLTKTTCLVGCYIHLLRPTAPPPLAVSGPVGPGLFMLMLIPDPTFHISFVLQEPVPDPTAEVSKADCFDQVFFIGLQVNFYKLP